MAVIGWSADRTLDGFLEFAAKGEAHAYLRHGQARFILAIAPAGDFYGTFLVGAEGFFEESIACRKELRRFMRSVVRRVGPVICVSKSPDPNALRWFRLLGATVASVVGSEKIYLWT